MLVLNTHKNVTTEEIELKSLDCAFWSIMKLKSLVADISSVCETKAVQMWLVSLKNPEQ